MFLCNIFNIKQSISGRKRKQESFMREPSVRRLLVRKIFEPFPRSWITIEHDVSIVIRRKLHPFHLLIQKTEQTLSFGLGKMETFLSWCYFLREKQKSLRKNMHEILVVYLQHIFVPVRFTVFIFSLPS